MKKYIYLFAIVLIAGFACAESITDTLSLDQSKIYTLDGKEYNILADWIASSSAGLFINGEGFMTGSVGYSVSFNNSINITPLKYNIFKNITFRLDSGEPAPILAHDLNLIDYTIPGTGAINQNITFSSKVKNIGNFSENSTLKFYIDNSEKTSCNQSITNLAAGASTQSYSCSWTAVEGNHTLKISVLQVTGETSTTDNTKLQSIVVSASPVLIHDQALLDYSIPASATSGQSVAFNSKVKNNGNYFENSTLKFYANNFELPSCTVNITSLVPGSTTQSYSCNWIAIQGTHALKITVLQVTGEENLLDNSFSQNITVSAPTNNHDLSLIEYTIPTNAASGNQVTFSTKVKNNGTNSENTTLKFYVDNIEQPSCTVQMPDLGSQVTTSLFSCAWAAVSGSHTLKINVVNVTGETSVADNTATQTINVSEQFTPMHDLALIDYIFPVNGTINQTINFSSKVKNNGNMQDSSQLIFYVDNAEQPCTQLVNLEQGVTSNFYSCSWKATIGLHNLKMNITKLSNETNYTNNFFAQDVMIFSVCSNGLDDDNDGKMDYPQDTGCTSAIDNEEFLDSDNDSIQDQFDNCPAQSNTGQENFDKDVQGNACDSDDDNDGLNDEIDNLIGNVSDINSTTFTNLSLFVNNQSTNNSFINQTYPVEIFDGLEPLIEFNWNFTNPFYADLRIEKQSSGLGSIIVSGIDLGNQTKTVWMNKVGSYNKVCVKDSEILYLSEISAKCDGSEEYLVSCNGELDRGFNCSIQGNYYKISGLRHSGIIEVQCTDEDKDGFFKEGGMCGTADCSDTDGNVNPGRSEVCGDSVDNNCNGVVNEGCSSGGGGGGGGYKVCTPQWNCTSFGVCDNGYQFRQCIDSNNCNKPSTMPALNQTCSLPEEIVEPIQDIEPITEKTPTDVVEKNSGNEEEFLPETIQENKEGLGDITGEVVSTGSFNSNKGLIIGIVVIVLIAGFAIKHYTKPKKTKKGKKKKSKLK